MRTPPVWECWNGGICRYVKVGDVMLRNLTEWIFKLMIPRKMSMSKIYRGKKLTTT